MQRAKKEIKTDGTQDLECLQNRDLAMSLSGTDG